jgi:hypothetical protein
MQEIGVVLGQALSGPGKGKSIASGGNESGNKQDIKDIAEARGVGDNPDGSLAAAADVIEIA